MADADKNHQNIIECDTCKLKILFCLIVLFILELIAAMINDIMYVRIVYTLELLVGACVVYYGILIHRIETILEQDTNNAD